MIRTAIFTLALAATLLAGCGSDERDQAAAAAGPAPKTDTDDTASKARSSAMRLAECSATTSTNSAGSGLSCGPTAPPSPRIRLLGVCWAGSPRWLQQFGVMLTD